MVGGDVSAWAFYFLINSEDALQNKILFLIIFFLMEWAVQILSSSRLLALRQFLLSHHSTNTNSWKLNPFILSGNGNKNRS
jgi:hypothetical protein